MANYIKVMIQNIEPLKIGANGNKSNQVEPSREHIAGSTLRGALIKYLKKLDENRLKEFLNHLYVYPAYPYEGKVYTPIPFHLRVDKHDYRKKKMEGEAFVSVKVLKDGQDNNKEKNHIKSKWGSIVKKGNETVIETFKVTTKYRLHHNIGKNKEEKDRDNIFRYQGIRENHCFLGILQWDDCLDDLMKKLIDQMREELQLYLGGSKGSGYGLCHMKSVGEPVKAYKDLELFDENSNEYVDNCITITCLSDCIFRDDYGQPMSYLSEKKIKEITGVEVIYKKGIIQTGLTEGYNMTWHARYPKETLVKAGSVLFYKTKSPMNQKEMQHIKEKLESQLVGYRTVDGFGWLGVNFGYPDKMMIQERVKAPKEIKDVQINQLLEHKEEPVKESFSILLRGFQSARERWFIQLYIKEKAHFTFGDISQTALTNMAEYLEELIDEREHKKNILERPYAKDNKVFGFEYKKNQYNFNRIVEFIKGSDKNSDLYKFAREHLEKYRGEMFFSKSIEQKDRRIEQLFIAFYIKHALLAKRKDGGGK